MNAWYAKGVEAFAGKLIDFDGDNIKALLAPGTYSPDMDNDQFVSTIPALAIVSRSPNLAGKSETGGVLNCSTVTFSLVGPSGTLIPYVVFYQDTGSDASSRLLFKYDTGQNLPVTAIGGDISVQIDTGPYKLARL